MTTVRIPGSEIGKDDQEERLQPGRTVHQRRLLELLRDRLEEAHQEPRRERDREGRVDDDQRPERVLEVELGDEPRQRKEEQRGRNEVHEKDRHACTLAPSAREPGQGVAGGEGEDERDTDHRRADEQGVPEPGRVVRVLEEEADVLERGVVPEVPVEVACQIVVRVGGVLRVGQVEVRLEHRDEREEEREREEDRERHDDEVGRELLASRHQLTWARRAKNSIPTLTTMSSGNRYSEIAAPSPSEPESIPTA